jgi:Conjugative transposon, TraM
MGFYMYIFPPESKAHEPKNEFASINLEIPSADKKIQEKNAVKSDEDNFDEDLSPLEVKQKATIELNNSRTDFIRRTSVHASNTSHRKATFTQHKANSNQPASTFHSFHKVEKPPENNTLYQIKHGQSIEKLELRMRELEEKKKGMITKTALATNTLASNKATKNEGFTFRDEDLIPKPVVDNDLSNPVYQPTKNHFFSDIDKKAQNFGTESPMISRNKKSVPFLIKGRLVESKIVRNNSTVKIMLMETKAIGNLLYESGDVIAAKTNIQGDRLILMVEGYIKNNSYQPLVAQVMDLDGLLGLKLSIDVDNDMQKSAWGQNSGSALGSVNPLLVYNPQGNLGQTVGNQVVGSLVNQSLNGANQYVNAKIRDLKVSIKTGQQLFLLIKN